MSLQRIFLPDPLEYFESQSLKITGSRSSKWFTTECRLHGGSDSMRVHRSSGGRVCTSCGAKGGDVIAYEMQLTGDEFIDVAKRLGVWVDDGLSNGVHKASVFSPRLALEVLDIEANLIYVAACNVANGESLTEADRKRLLTAVKRIQFISEAYK